MSDQGAATEKPNLNTITKELQRESRGSELVTTFAIEHLVYLSNCSSFLFSTEASQVYRLLEQYPPISFPQEPYIGTEVEIKFSTFAGGFFPLSSASIEGCPTLANGDDVVLADVTSSLTIEYNVSRLIVFGDKLIFIGGAVVWISPQTKSSEFVDIWSPGHRLRSRKIVDCEENPL